MGTSRYETVCPLLDACGRLEGRMGGSRLKDGVVLSDKPSNVENYVKARP